MMTRIAVWIVLFNVFVNASAVAIGQAGMADTHGFDPDPGGDFSEAEQAAQNAQNPGGGGLSTLFGLYYSLGGFISTIANAIPAYAMFKNLGVPELWVDFMFGGQAMFVGIGVIAFFRTGGGI